MVAAWVVAAGVAAADTDPAEATISGAVAAEAGGERAERHLSLCYDDLEALLKSRLEAVIVTGNEPRAAQGNGVVRQLAPHRRRCERAPMVRGAGSARLFLSRAGRQR